MMAVSGSSLGIPPTIPPTGPTMISPASDPGTLKSDLQAAAWVLEQLTLDRDNAASRSQIIRVLEDAADAWPARPEERWWKWLVEASRSLGFKCKVIDATFEQLAEMAQEGAQIIVRHGDEPQWLGIGRCRGRKIQVVTPQQHRERRWIRIGSLRRMLHVSKSREIIRCLVIEPPLVPGDGDSQEATRTPVARLTALLRAEWSDIWILLVFALVIGILALATPMAVETLVNTVAFGRLLQPVVILALMLFAFLAFSAALQGLQVFVAEIIQRRLFARISADLAFRLPRAQIPALDAESGRELVNRFFDVVTVQKVAALLLLDGISLALSTLIGMAVLAFYHPWLLGFDVVLLMLITVVMYLLGKGAVRTSIVESKMKYKMAAWLEDLAGCPTAFRHSGAAEFALERADRLTHGYLTARKRHFRILMRQIIFALAVYAVASTVLLGMGGWLVISGQLTLGQLVAAELIVTVIVGSFAKMGKHLESFYDVCASVDKLGVLFDLPMEPQEGLVTFRGDGPADVHICQVSYGVPPRKPLLDSLTLEIPRGEKLMISGPTGSGKTHLLDLLFGLRAPSEGHILVNGTDPRDLRPDAYRRQVSLIREVEIFTGTIAENVQLERPDISFQDVRDALEAAGLLDEVLHLPEGLETHLVSTGHPLTANQTRKLMIARAIAGHPRLLLIDQLIDALPDDDAEQITQYLVDSKRPWTLLMVTGRNALAKLGTRRFNLNLAARRAATEGQHAT